jgi:hypothetical protein
MRSWMIRWMAVSCLVGAVLSAFLCVCLLGVGHLKPHPRLGLAVFSPALLIWLDLTRRLARRLQD